MSSPGPQSAAARPSVFLSYASEDRNAARLLRDALGTAGLDVWYDESELGGGDAWDQKIRRQIRDCDYFMPVVSANTERRKEGYFRREWRLAVERTLDMADDVLFLLPVVIDDTNEARARVPEKFLTVQWLRAPAGHAGAALDALAQRLLAGDHTPLLSPLAQPEKPARAGSRPAPPPMPPFPQHPAKGSEWPKYIAEIVWWVITATWLLWNRLPRILRIVLILWIIVTLIGKCNRDPAPSTDEPSAPAANRPDFAAAIQAVTTAATQAGAGANRTFNVNIEATKEFVKSLLDGSVTGKPVVILRFSGAPKDSDTARVVASVYDRCVEKLQAARPGEIGVAQLASDAIGAETLPIAASTLSAGHVLGGVVTGEGAAATLTVTLLRGANREVVWTSTFPLASADVNAAAEQIATAVLSALPPLPTPR